MSGLRVVGAILPPFRIRKGPMYMKTLSIDIETYSSVDLAKCGVYKYTEATDFDMNDATIL